MRKVTIGVALTVLVAGALAFALAMLLVDTANATPHQPNVPVFTYGSL